MHFPSLQTLAIRGKEVVSRFPWTMAAGIVAATAAVLATTDARYTPWASIAMVAALGLPFSLALTLLAEERRWTAARTFGLNLAGAVLLVLFYVAWPGPDRKYEAIRYFQLSAGLHLLVAVLPFVGSSESLAFWHYNRRLFQAILRAVLFSLVLFVGLAIALGALDHLFGVNMPGEVYGRLFLVVAFVINTAIFLADVPRLRELASDRSYPRVLQVFAQYILTPIVFIYLVLLLAYLVKIIAGGEWPSGWIGWLVTSVAVVGLLGFLLVHPLRHESTQPWIRQYTRWLFIGLIPAAAVLLVAFWKRVLPYGLTELRLLGLVLGVWLLIIAVSYTLRPHAGIRRIPVSLAALFLLTLYGPFSMTGLSVSSQGRRLKKLIADGDNQPDRNREASAALRFLLDHGARAQVASAVRRQLPPFDWDSLGQGRSRQDSAAREILALRGVGYVPEHAYLRDGHFFFNADREAVIPLTGYRWMLEVSAGKAGPRLVDGDSVRIRFDSATGLARVLIGGDTTVLDLRRLAQSLMKDSVLTRADVPAERLAVTASTRRHRVKLALEHMDGRMDNDSVQLRGWYGSLFLGKQ